jgi:SNF2 family DNA or RNA helicase
MLRYRHLDGTLKSTRYHGQKREIEVATFEDSDIVLTTYHTLAADFAAPTSPVHEIAWFRVVLDEGRRTACYCSSSIRKARKMWKDGN